MSDGGGAWRSIGAHQVRLEAPNLFFLRDQGDMSTADVAQIMDEMRRCASVSGPLLVLNDISALRDVSLEARKVVAQNDVLKVVRAMAVFGGSFAQRIVATLALMAARLRLRRKGIPPIRFFATEAEARAWLEENRGDRA
jgi:hypothetical protein